MRYRGQFSFRTDALLNEADMATMVRDLQAWEGGVTAGLDEGMNPIFTVMVTTEMDMNIVDAMSEMLTMVAQLSPVAAMVVTAEMHNLDEFRRDDQM